MKNKHELTNEWESHSTMPVGNVAPLTRSDAAGVCPPKRKVAPIHRARPLHDDLVDRLRDMIIEGESDPARAA